MSMSTLVSKSTLRNARAWAPRTPVKWLAVIAAFIAAFAIQLIFHEYLGPHYPLLFFTLATLIVHFFFGLLPAVALALVSLPTGIYFFVPPYLSFSFPDTDDAFTISYYVGSTVLFMVLIQYLRRAQYQAVLLSEIAESRYLMLLDSEADRAAAETDMQSRQA